MCIPHYILIESNGFYKSIKIVLHLTFISKYLEALFPIEMLHTTARWTINTSCSVRVIGFISWTDVNKLKKVIFSIYCQKK